MRIAALLLVSIFPACGILFGNVKPAEQEARNYRVADLAKEKPDQWQRLESKDFGDEAFQSKVNGSTIAVHSHCSKHATRAPSSEELMRGLTDIRMKRRHNRTVAGVPAQETTMVGKMQDETEKTGLVALQSVVFQQGTCSYELVSVSQPQYFGEAQKAFSSFVQSFTFSSESSRSSESEQ